MAYSHEVKTTFPDLIIKQIEIIQKICSRELKDGDKILKNAMGEQLIEGDDSRHSYLQSIEVLGSMLSPYFGTSDIKFDAFCTYYDLELIEALEVGEFQKKMKDLFKVEDMKEIKENTKLQTQANLFLLNDKIKEGRKVFRDLIKIFKSNAFLAEEFYGDSGNGTDSSLDAVVDEEKGDILA